MGRELGSWVMYTIHRAEMKIQENERGKKGQTESFITFNLSFGEEIKSVMLPGIYSQVENPISTMRLSHMNFVRSPNII